MEKYELKNMIREVIEEIICEGVICKEVRDERYKKFVLVPYSDFEKEFCYRVSQICSERIIGSLSTVT